MRTAQEGIDSCLETSEASWRYTFSLANKARSQEENSGILGIFHQIAIKKAFPPFVWLHSRLMFQQDSGQ